MKQEEASRPSIQSEEIFRLVAENVSDFAIFAVDLDGRAASWNPGVEKLLGYAEEEWVGRDTCIIFTPEDNARGACAREMRTAAENGRAEDQRWHVRKDGSRFWSNGMMMALHDGSGILRGFTKIMRDETERRRAEETLSKSEERFRAFVTASSDVVYCMSADWSEMRHLQGRDFIPDTEDPSRAWLEKYIHPDDQPHVLAAIGEAIRTKSTFELEHRVIRVDGTLGWTHSRAIPLLDAEGEIVEWFGAARDVTKRKQAEEAAHEAGERFRFLAESMPQKIFTATPSGDVDYFNWQWTEFTGLSFEQIRDWGWLQFIHPDDVEENIRRWRHSINTGEPFQLEHRFRRSDGEYRWHLSRAHAMRDAEGNVMMWIGSNTDIDDVKRVEEKLREANRLKDEFLATLSHELRTPLTAILGWSRMLQTNTFDEAAQARALQTIQRNAQAQTQLIDDLLDTSRIITGKLRLDVRAVDLASVVMAAAETARPAAEAKNIRLQTLLDPQAGPVSGDPDRLQQVVWNLLSNAIKFTPKGGRVQVRLERVNSHVEITVSDTGRGIGAEFLPHVFDHFRQADQSTTRAHGGLGLGLAIVRQLVELHGGTVHVESSGEGHGATFTVSLPLLPIRTERRDDVPRVHPATRCGLALDCPPELDGLRVLVVDDEADTRELLTVVLTSCGAQVTTAASAAEALEQIERERPDVLVSDIGMPEEDGYSLISKVRQRPEKYGAGLPAAALTAYARAEDRVHALRSGFQMHLPKPVEPAELITVVANLAGRTGRQ